MSARATWGRLWAVLLGLALPCPALVLPVGAQTPGRALECSACHGELELLRQQVETLSQARRLLVPNSVLASSAHGDRACRACHEGFDRYPHQPGAGRTAGCADCHTAADTAWSEGAHAGADPASSAVCSDCHGVHDVATADDLGRAPLAMSERCVACHATVELAEGDPHREEAACQACHAAHTVRHVDDLRAAIAPARQAATCGACHDTVEASWREDVHGSAVAGEPRRLAAVTELDPREAPACTTCHGSHPTRALAGPGLVGAEVRRCAECHREYAETFGDSYHGQAAELGGRAVATCADCHAAHAILPASDPRSTVAPGRLVETCGDCHPQASPSFVEFEPHADPHDREKNPVLYWTYRFMTMLLWGVLGIFGLHAALWLARLGVARLRGEAGHGPHDASEGGAS